MIQEFNRKLEKLASLLARKKRLQDRLESLEEEEDRAVKEAGKAYRRMRKEDRDVEELKKVSLSNLLLDLRGAKDDRIRKEKREALEAGIQYRDAKQRQQEAVGQAASVRAELKRYEGLEETYEKLLEEKQHFIGSADREAAEEIERFIHQEEGLMEKLQKLEEFLEAGQRANSAMVKSIGFQRKAYGAGISDMVRISNHDVIYAEDKHTYVLRANLLATRAKNALLKVRQVLESVSESIDLPEIRIGKNLKFIDLYCDSLVIDFIVQTKIKKLLKESLVAQGRLKNMLTLFKKERDEVMAELGKIRRRRQDFVRNYV